MFDLDIKLIEAELERQHMSHRDLADRMYVTPTALKNILARGRAYNLTAWKIANALGLDFDEIGTRTKRR